MEDIFIVGAARTPIGKFGGSLAKMPASDLGALVIRKVLEDYSRKRHEEAGYLFVNASA